MRIKLAEDPEVPDGDYCRAQLSDPKASNKPPFDCPYLAQRVPARMPSRMFPDDADICRLFRTELPPSGLKCPDCVAAGERRLLGDQREVSRDDPASEVEFQTLCELELLLADLVGRVARNVFRDNLQRYGRLADLVLPLLRRRYPEPAPKEDQHGESF